jgi:hypothetical protein
LVEWVARHNDFTAAYTSCCCAAMALHYVMFICCTTLCHVASAAHHTRQANSGVRFSVTRATPRVIGCSDASIDTWGKASTHARILSPVEQWPREAEGETGRDGRNAVSQYISQAAADRQGTIRAKRGEERKRKRRHVADRHGQLRGQRY